MGEWVGGWLTYLHLNSATASDNALGLDAALDDLLGGWVGGWVGG